MLYKEWVDFVIYPSDADRVKTREQRLNIENAASEDDRYQNPEAVRKNGYIFSRDSFEFFSKDDIFEALWIDDDGNVTMWTENWVWSLHRRIDGKEKMTFLPRNPDISLLK